MATTFIRTKTGCNLERFGDAAWEIESLACSISNEASIEIFLVLGGYQISIR